MRHIAAPGGQALPQSPGCAHVPKLENNAAPAAAPAAGACCRSARSVLRARSASAPQSDARRPACARCPTRRARSFPAERRRRTKASTRAMPSRTSRTASASRARRGSRSATPSSASCGCRRPPRPRPPTASGRSIIRAPARAATSRTGAAIRPRPTIPTTMPKSMFLRLSIPPETEEQKRLLAEHKVNAIDEPTYGGQLQNLAIQGFDGEGHMHITYEEVPVKLADGSTVNVRKPTYSITDLKYGPLHPKTMMSPRVAPQMIGLGLIEAIPEDADPRPRRSRRQGRRRHLRAAPTRCGRWSTTRSMLGRFGWKAGVPSIRQQSGIGLRRRHGHVQPAGAQGVGRLHRGAKHLPQRAQRQQRARRQPRDRARSCSISSSSMRRTSPCRRGAMPRMRPSCRARRCSISSAARPATRPPSPRARSRASRISATRRSGPIPTCCCTTWATASPITARKAWRTGASGARRRCGVSVSPQTVSGHTLPPARRPRTQRRGSDPVARRRGASVARWLCGPVEGGARRARRLRELAVSARVCTGPCDRRRGVFSS